MKTITLREFFDAMEKNGYKKSKGIYINYVGHNAHNEVESACAMGQAALNLGVEPMNLSNALHHFKGYGFSLTGRVYSLNDETRKAVKTIAKEMRKEFKDKLDEVFTIW